MPSGPPRRREQRGILESLLGSPEENLVAPPEAPPPIVRPQTIEKQPAVLRFTVNLPAAIIEAARSAVYHTPGLTLSGLSVEALTREIERLERERGAPFPGSRGPMRLGRPVR
jgi:hypothetical protein